MKQLAATFLWMALTTGAFAQAPPLAIRVVLGQQGIELRNNYPARATAKIVAWDAVQKLTLREPPLGALASCRRVLFPYALRSKRNKRCFSSVTLHRKQGPPAGCQRSQGRRPER